MMRRIEYLNRYYIYVLYGCDNIEKDITDDFYYDNIHSVKLKNDMFVFCSNSKSYIEMVYRMYKPSKSVELTPENFIFHIRSMNFYNENGNNYDYDNFSRMYQCCFGQLRYENIDSILDNSFLRDMDLMKYGIEKSINNPDQEMIEILGLEDFVRC